GLIEKYRMEDAEYAVVAIGSCCGTIRTVVDEMREKGKKYGMLKLKCLRPFPEEEMRESLSKLNGITVLDRNISPGSHGAVYSEIKASLKNSKVRINNAILGLGGKDITQDDIRNAFGISEKEDEAEKWLI
ncbi:MAG: hypothetical protein NTV63_03210, partial [Candidatus Woesearchaeota archaeon]|nr:hypothetical protein [Candidatus Woesearchaeota archaeon]